MAISDLLPDYTVHHPVMDEHHHTLFRLIDQLDNAILEKNEHALIGEVLDSLLRYTKMHFAAEEHLMRMSCFPGMHEHKDAHDRLVNQVQELQRKHRRGDRAVIKQFMMRDWLVNHILGMDDLYVPYFRKAFGHTKKETDITVSEACVQPPPGPAETFRIQDSGGIRDTG